MTWKSLAPGASKGTEHAYSIWDLEREQEKQMCEYYLGGIVGGVPMRRRDFFPEFISAFFSLKNVQEKPVCACFFMCAGSVITNAEHNQPWKEVKENSTSVA